MPLVSYADLSAPARSDGSRKVYELVAARVEDRARPMPPDPTKRLSDSDIARLKSWASEGAAPGQACAAASDGVAPSTAAQSGQVSEAISQDVSADIEECFELRAHGSATPGDTTPYTVPDGEMYTTFIFKAPWTTPVQGLRFRHLPDNATVLHHWLLYSESANVADGTIEPCDLNGPTGFLCGSAETRGLITGWAPGRKDFSLPKDVGLELPGPSELLAVEFHYYNSTGAPAPDQSGVEVCVTSQFRANTASVSWLGTETINVPPKSAGTASGTCTPQRTGMNDSDPIHVLYSWPHMHKLGNHLKSIVNRAQGGTEIMYDGEFSFDYQVLYDSPMLLYPGDTVTTTCTFENTNDFEVNFGASTTMEMCFNFTYAWPAHALDNPGGALLSSTNSCFH